MTDKKFLKVTDKSCTDLSGDRHHQIMVGGELLTITFSHGKEKHLPFEQGVKFAGKDGFVVEDSDGIALGVGVTAEGIRHELADDEVVAKLTELTVDSLKLRAAAKKGGEMFLKAGDEDRADLIAFILGKPPVPEAPALPPANPPKDDDLGEVDTTTDPAPVVTDPTPNPQEGHEKPEVDEVEFDEEGTKGDAPKSDDAQA